MSSMYLDFNMIRKKSCLNIYLYNISSGFGLELYKWRNCSRNKLRTLEIIENVIQLKIDLLIKLMVLHMQYIYCYSMEFIVIFKLVKKNKIETNNTDCFKAPNSFSIIILIKYSNKFIKQLVELHLVALIELTN